MKHLHVVERAIAKKLKMTRYFTGRPCQRGHLSERQTGNFKCCECDASDRLSESRRSYIREYHSKNDRKGYMKKWVSENHERKKSVNREYYSRNREEKVVAQKEYYENNKHRLLAQQKEYYLANRQKIRAKQREAYLRNHSDYVARARETRLSRKRRFVKWDLELTHFVFSEAIHLCSLREVLTGLKWNVDHMLPMKGKKVSGLHVWNNLQVIPKYLNAEKTNHPIFTEPFSWMARCEARP